MNYEDFKKLDAYQQEIVLLLGRIAKALEGLTKEMED